MKNTEYPPHSQYPIHIVQLYNSEEFLVKKIRTFITQGNAGLIIARKKLKHKILKDLPKDGTYVFIDASRLMKKFIADGLPHRILFERTFEPLVRDFIQQHPDAYVFGEMISILWQQEDVAGSVILVEMWNELQRKYNFPLLSAYHQKQALDPMYKQQFEYLCSRQTNFQFEYSFQKKTKQKLRLLQEH